MKNLYCGVTLGPIYKTISQARKTRELWSGSYLFSYLMKELIRALEIEDKRLILPYAGKLLSGVEEVDLLNSPLQAGVFPDRLVFQLAEAQSISFVREQSHAVVKKLSDQLTGHLKQHSKWSDQDQQRAESYFAQYFQVYAVTREFEESCRDKREIVMSLFDTLDILELQSQLIPEEEKPYIERFMTTSSFRTRKTRSFLKADAGLEAQRFESIIEIAAKELITDQKAFDTKMEAIDKEDNEDNLINWLKENNKETFRTHHKYIAIVNIDGDNFGDYIKQLDNPAYDQFTQALALFSLQARDAIEAYGGQPVYLGGDDALFFAPVRRDTKEKRQNIFDLLDDIDEIFRRALAHIQSSEASSLPTLSAGVAIHYYKHPLAESLEKSAKLLFDKAKHFSMRNGGKKNAIAIQVQKHSGQSFGLVLRKSADTYARFKAMLSAHIDDGIFLSSVVQHMERNKALLAVVGEAENRVADFIENQFNESVHKQSPFREFLDGLKVFVPGVYKEYPLKDPLTTEAAAKRDIKAETLYGALRLVKFLNRDDNE